MPKGAKCMFGCKNFSSLHRFPKPSQAGKFGKFEQWKSLVGSFLEGRTDQYIYMNCYVCNMHFEGRFLFPYSKRLAKTAYPTVNLCYYKQHKRNAPVTEVPIIVQFTGTKLEICIDSLESARNAVNGGADELEVCSTLNEGGLTPSPGLVKEILELCTEVNVMIRCRPGSDFCYTDDEMTTMLSDIKFYKDMGVDRFVFGALTDTKGIDKINCGKVIEMARPLPVTFHRAFDLCAHPDEALVDIIHLGFDRLLTSGLQPLATTSEAVETLKRIKTKHGHEISIMPGSGINSKNVEQFVIEAFPIVHSSCKKKLTKNTDDGDINMGSNDIYITDERLVRELKLVLDKRE